MMSTDGMPGVAWRKSSYSGNNGGDCVEVGSGLSGVVPVRDSKVPAGPVLVLADGAWAGFVSAVCTGELSA
ncbi:DUF397 domain-containing protein [Streptomyces sp. AM 4-1-1]|uniref:DUF397 domain-containing protein n=1 Tax=Streptomyces sp. AM 4-1-1 TaxID=3028710 RepID=UPI0023B9BC2C|nr:DUF397 domain-containing protein [Streptomyces sp. AM 4-1-1]WEH33295.1 DUF397 domain-containing protein [Streptomyces sp. AM 4-1-1]